MGRADAGPLPGRLKDGTVVQVRERGTGALRQLGKVHGDTFRLFEREESRHMFRGGDASVKTALAKGSAAWGLDLEVAEGLYERHGVRVVEIPTRTKVYRARLEDLLGPKSFVKEYGSHRPQTMLPVQYWTITTRNER